MLVKERVQEIYSKALERSPIFYGSITYFFPLPARSKKSPIKMEAKQILMKGTPDQIINSNSVKRSVLLYHFGGNKEAKKKAHKFDIDKIKLAKPQFKKFLGYGVVESEKSRW